MTTRYRLAVALLLAALPASAAAVQEQVSRHAMKGLVVDVNSSRTRFVVSHESVPGVMPAMTMPFDVQQAKDLEGITAGTIVEFTLVMGQESAYAEGIRIRHYESSEQDPLTARRLKLLTDITASVASGGGASVKPSTTALAIGETVPDFTLIDQAHRRIAFSELRGKVVAVNFIYTSCALPQFCFRIANHFSVLQKRFSDRLAKDIVLLTVTFDPERDHPDALAEYAKQWKSSPDGWRFLTGDVPDVRRVCNLFGVDFYQDEGLMNHSSHTAVIDRRGILVANIEGNEFSATQLGDLVDTILNR
jgi:protein SCO1